jgi:hypothetical protein
VTGELSTASSDREQRERGSDVEQLCGAPQVGEAQEENLFGLHDLILPASRHRDYYHCPD